MTYFRNTIRHQQVPTVPELNSKPSESWRCLVNNIPSLSWCMVSVNNFGMVLIEVDICQSMFQIRTRFIYSKYWDAWWGTLVGADSLGHSQWTELGLERTTSNDSWYICYPSSLTRSTPHKPLQQLTDIAPTNLIGQWVILFNLSREISQRF